MYPFFEGSTVMKVAIIGSRNLKVNLDIHIPKDATLIISGGANGIDRLAEEYADKHRISKLIIKPEYDKYGKTAPLVRNKKIVDSADMVIAFWDGQSRGTSNVIEYAKSVGKRLIVHKLVSEIFE